MALAQGLGAKVGGVGLKQVSGHGDVPDALGVNVCAGQAGRLGGVHGAERVEKVLHAGRGQAPLAEEPLKRVVRGGAVKAAERALGGGPEGVPKAKEGAGRAVVVKRAAHPGAGLHGGRQRGLGVRAGDDGWQVKGGGRRHVLLGCGRGAGCGGDVGGACAGELGQAARHAGEAQG